MEVCRLVDLIVEGERSGLVQKQRSGGNRFAAAIPRDSLVERRRVGKWLKGRPGLPLGQHVVQLATGIVATTDQRANVSRRGVECDESHLRELALLLFATHPTELLVNLRHAFLHCINSSLLKVQVQSRVNAVAVRCKVPVLEAALQVVVYEIDEE